MATKTPLVLGVKGPAQLASGDTIAITNLPASGVTPGAYTLSNVTVNTQGQVTTAASGDALAIAYAIAFGGR